jgi:uncharacterized protein YbcI
VRADRTSSVPLDGECLAEVSRSIVQLYRRFYGRGPTRAKTIADGHVMTTVLEEVLTTVERTLIERDRHDLVAEVRTSFQTAMRREFVETVERVTRREVAGFSSGVDVDNDLASETFVFAPSTDPAPLAVGRSTASEGAESSTSAVAAGARDDTRSRARETREEARALRAQAAQVRRRYPRSSQADDVEDDILDERT